MMRIDFLIIGQGISGTWLSYYLQKEGKSFLVIDNNYHDSASRIAAGIINPVTGRRHVTVWKAEEILPFAWNAYHGMGKDLGITAISQKNIIEFFPGPQMRLSFLNRMDEDNRYVNSGPEHNQFNQIFNYDFGCGEIKPVYLSSPESLLPAWRKQLKSKNQLLEEKFELIDLKILPGEIQYREITASAILFCDGNSSMHNPYFNQLPFAPNKGEVLIAQIPGLPGDHIYKKGMVLAPLTREDLWWIGSNYRWEFDHTNPTREFRETTERFLKDWLRIPFKIVDHLSGIRPATLERRPFVGMHPLFPALGILNGMGAKGCSLAPFFANQLADYLLSGKPILPEADIKRFSGILTRNHPSA